MLYIGHDDCYDALDKILRAYEAGKYNRLVMYAPGESILFDSKPAPGYVPGIPSKKEGGAEYVPAADGTRVHLYYLSGQKADKRAKAEAARALRSGFDSHEIMGTLVSIRRLTDGNIQLQFVAGNRDTIENGVVTDKLAIRSVSVTNDPSKKGGLIVAMGFDQSLGIPYYQLKSLLESQTVENFGVTTISDGLRRIQREAKGIPDALKEPGTGATGTGQEVA